MDYFYLGKLGSGGIKNGRVGLRTPSNDSNISNLTESKQKVSNFCDQFLPKQVTPILTRETKIDLSPKKTAIFMEKRLSPDRNQVKATNLRIEQF